MHRFEPDTEVTILALADRLGIRRPAFGRAARPSLWQCWADRVLAAGVVADRGQDPAAAVGEAQRYDGHPQPPQPYPAPWPGPIQAPAHPEVS